MSCWRVENYFITGFLRLLLQYISIINCNIARRELFVRFRCNNNKNYMLNYYNYIKIINAYYDGWFKLICNNELIGRFWGAVDLLDKDGRLVLRTPDGYLLALDSLDLTIFSRNLAP